MVDMKIRDEELLDYASEVDSLGKNIDSRIETLKNQLEKACNEGVTNGTFHENLALFIETLSVIQDGLSEKTAILKNTICQYDDDIDSMDGFIY